MVQTLTHGIGKESWYRHGLMVLAKNYGKAWTHGIKKGIVVKTQTPVHKINVSQKRIKKSIDNTHGIDNSWYSIGTPESHTYERAKC